MIIGIDELVAMDDKYIHATRIHEQESMLKNNYDILFDVEASFLKLADEICEKSEDPNGYCEKVYLIPNLETSDTIFNIIVGMLKNPTPGLFRSFVGRGAIRTLRIDEDNTMFIKLN